MTKTRICIIILLLMGITSCVDNQNQLPYSENAVTLILEEQNVEVDIAIVDRVPLETNSESLFGESFRIHFYKDRFYILDPWSTGTLFVFSKEGGYLNKIALGKGSGECVKVSAFYVDYIDDQVLIWDAALRRMNKFDLDLNYISSKVLEGKIIRQFERHRDKGWIVCARERILTNERDYTYYHYSDSFDSIYQSVLPIPLTHVSNGFMNPISRDTEAPQLVVRHFDNHLYNFTADGIEVLYELDFGQFAIKEVDLNKGSSIIKDLISTGKRKTYIDQLIHSKKYLAFTYFFRNQTEYYIYNKESGNIYSSINLVEQGKLPYGRLMACENNEFILSVEQPEYGRFEKALKGENVSVPNSTNEILVLFTISDSIRNFK